MSFTICPLYTVGVTVVELPVVVLKLNPEGTLQVADWPVLILKTVLPQKISGPVMAGA